MSSDNIFDLSKIATNTANSTEKKQQIMTPDDINKCTEGYTQIPESEWRNIPADSLIRYLRKDGHFRRGGYVENVSIDTLTGSPTVRITIRPQYNSFAQRSWSVNSNSIEKIWIKHTGAKTAPPLNSQVITELKEDISFCKESMAQIIKEIQKINNENARIVQLIKKLHRL